MSDTSTDSASSPRAPLLSDWALDLVAGWASGAAAVLACQPVDTVLTRWQAAPVIAAATNTANTASASASTSTMRGLAAQLYQTAGPSALWRGASPMIASVPVQNALLMAGYGFGQRFFGEDGGGGSERLGAIFVGGCTGGLLQSFLMSPVELIKVTQQCSSSRRGIVSARGVVQSLLLSGGKSSNNGGSRQWLRGLNATLLRDGIPHGVWFVSYDVTKHAMLRAMGCDPNSGRASGEDDDEDSNLPVQVPLVSGAVAATVAWAVGYPADLIKTRIQAASAAAAGSRGIRATARELIAEADGRVWRGLYRGFGMKLVRSVPASMIGFTVYETVKEQILRLERQL